MKNKMLLNRIARILLIIGGLNWGLVGLFGWDVIASVFGQMSMVSRVIYVLIGLSALHRVVRWLRSAK